MWEEAIYILRPGNASVRYILRLEEWQGIYLNFPHLWAPILQSCHYSPHPAGSGDQLGKWWLLSDTAGLQVHG